MEDNKFVPKEAMSFNALEKKHKQMKDLPFIKTGELVSGLLSEQLQPENVSPDVIVGTPNFKDWSDEYHKDWQGSGTSSVEEMSKLISEDSETFWENNQNPVKLVKVNGPKGAIYAVEDGSHRAAAAKLAEVDSIPAEVVDYSTATEFSTMKSDESRQIWWEALIESGAIDGEITQNGQSVTLKLNEPPPVHWMVSGSREFKKGNEVYKKVYGENALDDLQIPDSLRESMNDAADLMIWGNRQLRE